MSFKIYGLIPLAFCLRIKKNTSLLLTLLATRNYKQEQLERVSLTPWLQTPQLTLKHRETHGCVVSNVATDALVLNHQAISIHNAD